jgi:hypothetical protein
MFVIIPITADVAEDNTTTKPYMVCVVTCPNSLIRDVIRWQEMAQKYRN